MPDPTEIPAAYAADRCERVRVDLLTGCWEWTGPVIDGVPYTHLLSTGKGATRADRYFVQAAYGGRVPKWARYRRICKGDLCVNPAHQVSTNGC
jgi:hypothetical protein